MKAKPVRLVYGSGYVQCSVEDATHVTLNIPGPTGKLTLPVIQRGSRDDTGCWTWNGSTEAPTLRPSVRTEGCSEKSNGPFLCHSWINDGAAQFLSDCSHDLVNQTVPLLEVPADGVPVDRKPLPMAGLSAWLRATASTMPQGEDRQTILQWSQDVDTARGVPDGVKGLGE